jgi:hypothetical protein
MWQNIGSYNDGERFGESRCWLEDECQHRDEHETESEPEHEKEHERK